MTFREKLADWLTGGRYRYLSDKSERMDRAFDQKRGYILKIDKMEQRLRTIASIPVTPSSNGQTRKAVRIAKEALQG